MSKEGDLASKQSSREIVDPDNPGQCVYFVFVQGLVKIGRMTDLKKRLRSLRYDEFPQGVKGFGPIERTLFILVQENRVRPSTGSGHRL